VAVVRSESGAYLQRRWRPARAPPCFGKGCAVATPGSPTSTARTWYMYAWETCVKPSSAVTANVTLMVRSGEPTLAGPGQGSAGRWQRRWNKQTPLDVCAQIVGWADARYLYSCLRNEGSLCACETVAGCRLHCVLQSCPWMVTARIRPGLAPFGRLGLGDRIIAAAPSAWLVTSIFQAPSAPTASAAPAAPPPPPPRTCPTSHHRRDPQTPPAMSQVHALSDDQVGSPRPAQLQLPTTHHPPSVTSTAPANHAPHGRSPASSRR
jgi:hypothetical protein